MNEDYLQLCAPAVPMWAAYADEDGMVSFEPVVALVLIRSGTITYVRELVAYADMITEPDAPNYLGMTTVKSPIPPFIHHLAAEYLEKCRKESANV